jgi:hypothetical protein
VGLHKNSAQYSHGGLNKDVSETEQDITREIALRLIALLYFKGNAVLIVLL